MKLFQVAWLAVLTIFGGSAAIAGCTIPANSNDYATQIAYGLNAQRASAGLSQLYYNYTLSQAAATHACDMQLNHFFAHRGSDGSNSHQRVNRTSYSSCYTAENLAFGYANPMTVINGWMNSPGHRRNMLAQQPTEFGVSVVDGANGPIVALVMARRC